MILLKKKSTRRGFTLVELLTVIAIIGILAAIIIPTVGAVQERASRTKSASNVRQIAQSYQIYSTGGSRIRTIGAAQAATVKDWAEFLAQNADLNDASLWLIDADPEVSALTSIPRVILAGDTPAPDWASMVDSAMGYSVVVGMSANAPTSTTPLLWTKGLDATSGDWTGSPWGEGGHIGFMDAHVEFFDTLNDGEGGSLVNGTTGLRTASITDAITTTTAGTPPTVLEPLGSGSSE